MAVLGRGMELRALAGVGWIEFRVITTPGPGWVIIGLVPWAARGVVADGQVPPNCWQGDGRVDWILSSPAPANGIVKFGQGDRVMLVLDCRAEPLVRVFVNSKLCLVHTLTVAKHDTPKCFLPAVALAGAACVELMADALLQPGWDDHQQAPS